jgi:hypothetical protein
VAFEREITAIEQLTVGSKLVHVVKKVVEELSADISNAVEGLEGA